MSHVRRTLSVSALLTSGAEEFCVGSGVGGVMCTAGRFAASLEDAISNLPTPQHPPKAVTAKLVFRHCQMCPGGKTASS